MSEPEAVKRAKEIVRAQEWTGDMRVNMTTIIGAGRVLAKRIDELNAIIHETKSKAALQQLADEAQELDMGY